MTEKTDKTPNYEYLNLLARKLDDSQKKVCCRTENTVVAAGAGSGKTQVLATRFAWLVMSKDVPASEILTLTFTNKAAAEMYSRIYETLGFFAENSDVPAKERANAKRAVEEFSGVHIQTLDSYCTGLVRKAANRYGIRPDFTAGSADSAGNIRDAAFSFILKHRNDEAVRFFAEAGKLQDFARNYFGAIIERCSSIADGANVFSNFLDVQKKIIAEEWNSASQALGSILQDLNAALKENKTAGDAYFDSLESAVSDFPEIFNISSPELIESDSAVLKAVNDCASALKFIASIKTGRRGKLPADVKAVNDIHKELNALASSRILPMSAYITQYPYVKRLFALLDEFKAEVDAQKRATGNLTFRDVSESALKILCEQKDIREEEKNLYSKIMIDEFQDNNSSNRDLLFLLSEKKSLSTDINYCGAASSEIRDSLKNSLEPDKLFFVGDEKQSIYKFRGADVSVFNELTFDLHTDTLKMTANYRSLPELLTTFNGLFGGYEAAEDKRKPAVFDERPAEKFEAAYPIDVCAKKVDPDTHKDLPHAVLNAENIKTHICLVDEDFLSEQKKLSGTDSPEYLDSLDQEAYFIASKIKELYSQMPEDSRSYSSFAVLDVKRTHRAKLIFWLNRLGIPYSIDVQSGIFREAIANDIYSFIRLCVYPGDTAAFAAFLRSPFSGMSINGVISVMSIFDEDDFIPFTQEKNEKLKRSLSQSDFEKYLAAACFYADARKQVLSRKLTDTIEELWYESGYYHETMLNSDVFLIAEQFDLLFELARRTDEDGKSPAWFVDQLALVRESEKNSFAAEPDIAIDDITYPVEKKDSVQIMTVHKSKGLQFAHVFVTGCFQKPRNDKAEHFFYDEFTGLSLKPRSGEGNFFFLRQKELSDKKTLAEFKRVIYVAITRAEKSVYILGTKKKRKEESKSTLENIVDFYYANIFPQPSENPCTLFKDKTPFCVEFIPLKEKSLLYETAASKTHLSKTEIVQGKSGAIKAAKEVPFIPSEIKKITPSSLETFYKPDAARSFGDEEKHIFTDSEVLKDSKFTAADFGTLIHDCLHSWALGVRIEDYEAPAALLKNLNASEIKRIYSDCINLCTAFTSSQIAADFIDAKNSDRFYRAEWEFKNLNGEYIVTGSMDLIFQNADNTYTLVDYKSDTDCVPERYYAQQTCYRQAAAALLAVSTADIKPVLYYLRTAESIDISAQTESDLRIKDLQKN